MKHLAVFLLVLILILGAGIVGYPASIPKPPQAVPIHVTIEGVDRVICSSIPLNTHPTLYLTALHCVAVGDEVKDVTLDYTATSVWAVDKESDLALLYSMALEHKAGANLAFSEPKQGDDIHVYSFPLGLSAPQYIAGKISSTRTIHQDDKKTYMMFGIGNCKGSSGSGVLNKNEEVVSVLQIGMDITPFSNCTPFMGGVTFEKLKTFVDPWL